jgi:hypothetical protein
MTGRLRVLIVALCGTSPPAAALDLELYDQVLETHTQETADLAGVRVDYEGLRNSELWPPVLSSLAESAPPVGDAAETAFWINAYNILAIDLVVRGAPEQSLRDLGSWFRPVWKRIAGRVGGEPVTLHQIEHEILRPRGDPRIHAAIVCASLSCPPLRRRAYRGADLDSQLDVQVAVWLANPRKGARVENGALWLNPIFDWFEEDFGGRSGVVAFVARYLDSRRRSRVDALGAKPRIRYMDYDWSLNAL